MSLLAAKDAMAALDIATGLIKETASIKYFLEIFGQVWYRGVKWLVMILQVILQVSIKAKGSS